MAVGEEVFSRPPKNPLKTVIFTDGQIANLQQDGNVVLVEYVDYTGAHLKITFHGVERLKCCVEPTNPEVMSASFEYRDNRWRIRLSDDDDAEVVSIEYENASIKIQ